MPHAGRQDLPWIFTMHSDDPDYWCVAEALTPETHGGSSVCVSQFLAQQLRQRLPATNPQVIPYGITLPKTQASFSDQPFRVVYSGRMVERQKCIQKVVRTLIHACRASSQIEALLIGDGPERAACQRLVQQAGLTDRIHFLGRVSPNQVLPLLLRSQAILLMSEFEGLPVALLEAMAAGVVPVVREIESGIPELVHHEGTGLLVGNDPSEAASALVRLSLDPSLWQRCSCQSRALIESGYDADLCFERWLGIGQHHLGFTRPTYPIDTTDLHHLLPVTDSCFQITYPSRRSQWCQSNLKRLLRGLLRRTGRMA